MSKEKPEVGDVWEDKTKRIVIVAIQGCFYDFLFIDFFDKKLRISTVYTDDLNQCFNYLGKSKVSIKELFDVKD